MLTMATVTDEICTVLRKEWPGWKIYRQTCSEDFEPPALLVEIKKQERRIMNKALYEETALITVTCFGETDSGGMIDADALAKAAEDLHRTFSAGYLHVGCRAARFSPRETTFEADCCKTVFYCGLVESNAGELLPPPMRVLNSRTKA